MIGDIPSWLIWASNLSAVIAIPGAIAAFITLFRKDRSKQLQISKLTDISLSLDSQNSILKETLNYYREQLQILTNLYNLTENHAAVQDNMIKLEKDIKLAQSKPVLKYTGGPISPKEMKVRLMITNADAFEVKSEVIENDNIIILNKGPYDFEKDSTYGLVMHARGSDNAKRFSGKIMISYKDQLSNEYKLFLSIENGNIMLEKPTLVDN